MASGLRIFPDTIRSADSAVFDGTFQVLGSSLTHASPLMKFVNDSNVLVTISWDDLNAHDILPAGSFALYDFSSDAGTVRGLFAAKGTQFYVKGTAGGTNAGLVYLVVFYSSEDL